MPSSFTTHSFSRPTMYRIISHARKPYQSRTSFRLGAGARRINAPPAYSLDKPAALCRRSVTRGYWTYLTRGSRYGGRRPGWVCLGR